jgi:hypothetical protein
MSKPARSKKKQEHSGSNLDSPAVEMNAATSRPTDEQIQKRAYEIYLERGGADGSDVDDWLQAERELGGLNS